MPPALAAFAERADLAERVAERERGAVLAAVLDWASRRATAPARDLRAVLALVEGDDGPAVALEALVTSTRLRDEPRTQAQLEQLRNECQRSPGLMAPEQRALLELLVRHRVGPSVAGEREAVSPGALARVLERFGGSPLVTWNTVLPEGLAQRFGVTAETPAQLAREVVRIVPDLVATAADPRLALDRRSGRTVARDRLPRC